MKIIIFTQEDPIYIDLFFTEFFKKCNCMDDIKAVVVSKPMGKESIITFAHQMLKFYGFKDFFKIGRRYVRKKITSMQIVSKLAINYKENVSLKKKCENEGIQVYMRNDLNSDDFKITMESLDPDLFISVASPIIWKNGLINTPKMDSINIHCAPLPNYRGMLPSFWQMFNGEKYAGITIHRIDSGIDTGDIIRREMVEICRTGTLDHLIKTTKKRSAQVLARVIEDYKNNKIRYSKMPQGGSYYSFPSPADVKKFRSRGYQLI